MYTTDILPGVQRNVEKCNIFSTKAKDITACIWDEWNSWTIKLQSNRVPLRNLIPRKLQGSFCPSTFLAYLHTTQYFTSTYMQDSYPIVVSFMQVVIWTTRKFATFPPLYLRRTFVLFQEYWSHISSKI